MSKDSDEARKLDDINRLPTAKEVMELEEKRRQLAKQEKLKQDAKLPKTIAKKKSPSLSGIL